MWSKRFAERVLYPCVLASGLAVPASSSAMAASPDGPPGDPAGSTTVVQNAPAVAPVPERAMRQFGQALAMMKAGRMTDAELELKQLSLAYPDLPGPQLNLGLVLAHAARLNEAQEAFKAALALDPGSAIAHSELGIVDRRLGKFADAEADYQRAIAADPRYAPAHLNLGILYELYLLQPQKALEQFELYLGIVGDSKPVSGWVAELRKRLGIKAPATVAPPAGGPAPASEAEAGAESPKERT